MSAKTKVTNIPDAVTYRALVDDLAILTDATAHFAALESNLQLAWTEIVDRHRDEYAILQSTISEHEAAVKLVAMQHPEWFEVIKTLKTPYGTVGFRSATKLEVPNEELSIALIERALDSEIYLRTRKFLNLEALESLEDFQLKGLQITRVTTDKCTVTPAKIDLGKAVKKAVETKEVTV